MPDLTEPSRHTVYYELLDACKRGGCPICTVVLDTVARYLDILIYENVNDPQTRDAVVAARGYCNAHSWQLRAQSGAAFGTALLYRDVLQHLAEEIGRQSAGGYCAIFTTDRSGGKLLHRLAGLTGSAEGNEKGCGITDPHVACPGCRLRERYERIYLGVLLDHLGEDEFRRALQSAGGLCLVHLDRARATTRHAHALERLWGLCSAPVCSPCSRSLARSFASTITGSRQRAWERRGPHGSEPSRWWRASRASDDLTRHEPGGGRRAHGQ